MMNPAAASQHQFFNMANDNTTMYVGQIYFPFGIIANKITMRGFQNGASGPKVSLYSEDGQTRLFSHQIVNMTGSTGVFSETLSSIVIPPGIYYISVVCVPSGGGDGLDMLQTADPNTSFNGTISGKPVWQGTLTVSAATPPATITPSAITPLGNNSTLAVVFNN